MIGRREFITLMRGAVAAWPLATRAQQGERMRRGGVILPAAEDNADFQVWVGAFQKELALLGWNIDRNVRIDMRWGARDTELIRRYAAELIGLVPDVILAHGISTVGPLRQATRTVPIVFPVMADPVGLGIVNSLARPGGNVTGFVTSEFSLSGKWLELLKQVAPDVTRAVVLRDPVMGSGASQYAAVQAVAASLRV